MGSQRVRHTERLSLHNHYSLYKHKCAVCAQSPQSCPTLQHQGLQPTRLLCPWNFPGKNTGVAISSSRESSQPRDRTHVPCIFCTGRHILYHWHHLRNPNVNICVYARICMYMHVCVCICMYMYVYACLCMYMHVYVYIHVCVYIHICIHLTSKINKKKKTH